jgi:F-type H+-transporting ATPase subunit delta
MAKLVSKTYGEALFELAMEENRAQEMMEEIFDLQTALSKNPDFDKLMKHPKISKPEKEEVVETVFAERVSREMTGFLKLIVHKERYHEVKNIIRYFAERLREERGIGVAYVTTAVDLSDDRKEAVKRKLLETTSYKVMEVHYKVDPSIIGGMIIRIKDRVVDSSVRTKLEEMKKQLLQIQLG